MPRHARVTSERVKDAAIQTVDLKDAAVTSAKIDADAVGSQHLADNAIAYAAQVKGDTIGSQHLADNAIAYAAQVKDSVLGTTKTNFLVQSGSVATGNYFTYPQSLSTLLGWPVVAPKGAANPDGYSQPAAVRADTGSCYVDGGSPGIYAAVIVWGLK